MIYIAKHFVKIAGRKYTPGEIITSAIQMTSCNASCALKRLRARRQMSAARKHQAHSTVPQRMTALLEAKMPCMTAKAMMKPKSPKRR